MKFDIKNNDKHLNNNSFVYILSLLILMVIEQSISLASNTVEKNTNTESKNLQIRDLYKTTYKGHLVYYRTSACCDIPAKLIDANGKLICYPNGGFISVDEKCPDFKFDRAKSTKVEGLPDYMLKKVH